MREELVMEIRSLAHEGAVIALAQARAAKQLAALDHSKAASA